MSDGELVVLFNEDNDVYCKYYYFALGSEEAKEAHENIQKIKQEGCRIINVENMNEEEIDLFLERINKRIEEYSTLNTIYINMIIKANDLEQFFGPDGFCFVDDLKCSTTDIIKLVNNPDKPMQLKDIREVPYVYVEPQEEWPRGYMIPMVASGNFFSLDEAKDIFSLNSINTTRIGLDCQFALNTNSIKNSMFMKSARRATQTDASDEDIERFEKKKQLLFEEYKANYDLIQSYKDTKEEVLEIYSRNNRRM